MAGNGDLQVREQRMHLARRQVERLAFQGLSVDEILGRLDEDLNETERAIVLGLARMEVTSARRRRIGESLRNGSDPFLT
jgi:hypothetical protein